MWGLVLQQPPRLELVTAQLSLQVTLLLILKIPDHLGIVIVECSSCTVLSHYVARPPALLSPCALRPLTLLPSPPLDLTSRKSSLLTDHTCKWPLETNIQG